MPELHLPVTRLISSPGSHDTPGEGRDARWSGAPNWPTSRRMDERVTRVLAAIHDADDLRMSVEDAAAMIVLSPSRFAHLFKQQVGLPFRRYMLWRKLARATLVVGRERTLAAAAHAADFADAVHLTRTFYEMSGMPPSVMMRGEFFEIPSPVAR